MKNSKKVYIIITMVLFFFIAVTAFCLINNHKIYVPEEYQKTFTLMNQMLLPDSSSIYIEPIIQPGNKHGLFNYSVNYFITSWSAYRDQFSNPQNGKIDINQRTLTFNSDGVLTKNIVKQDCFHKTASLRLEDLDANQYYVAWLAFDMPLSIEETLNKISSFTESEDFKVNRKSGVLWMSVISSSNERDIAIGIKGNLSWNFIGYPQSKTKTQWYIDKNFYEIESAFIHDLKYLSNNQETVNAFAFSGIYGEKVKIDFSERAKYINTNKVLINGVVLYGNLSNLSCLEYSDTHFAHLIPDMRGGSRIS